MPGLAPAGDLLSLLRQRKVGKERRPLLFATPGAWQRRGQPAVLGPSGVRRKLAFGSDNGGPDPLGPARLGATRRGLDCRAYQDRRPRSMQAAAVRHWLFVCPAVQPPYPVCMRLRCAASVGSGPPLSEPKASFGGPRPKLCSAGCPEAAKLRGRRQPGRLSLGYLYLAKQRKVPRPPGRVPAHSAKTITTLQKAAPMQPRPFIPNCVCRKAGDLAIPGDGSPSTPRLSIAVDAVWYEAGRPGHTPPPIVTRRCVGARRASRPRRATAPAAPLRTRPASESRWRLAARSTPRWRSR